MSTSTVQPTTEVNNTNSNVTNAKQEWWQTEKPAHTSDHLAIENYTLVIGYTKEEAAKENAKQGDGKLSAKPEGEDTEEAITKGDFVEVFRQTFRQYFPSSLEGINELIPDDEEKLNLVCASLKVKEANRARSLVVSKSFTPQNFTIDLFEQAGEKSERRLTPQQKVEREIFENFSPEMQRALLAKLQAMQNAGQ